MKVENKKLIIFDMDGTILNTLLDLQASVNFALTKHHFPTRDYEQIRRAVGNGVAMLVKRSLPSDVADEKYKEVLKDFEDYYALHSEDKTVPYDGIISTLKALKEKGYLLAVATNKIENVAKDLVNKIFPNIFLTTCGDNGKRNKKPAPDCVFEIQKRLGVSNINEVVYIGDSEVDYMTAINSKATPIVLTYGYRTLEELKPFIKEDTLIANTPEEILKYL